MDEDTKDSEAEASDFDATVELFSEYYEGTMDAADASKLEDRIAADAQLKKAYADFEKTMEMLSGLHKMSAPLDFDKKVEETIHRRSGGRFFGKRAFGDRIPYEVLAVIVMLVAGAVYWMGRSSATGSHKLDRDNKPEIHEGARDVVPRL